VLELAVSEGRELTAAPFDGFRLEPSDLWMPVPTPTSARGHRVLSPRRET
jgi:hypothetical protein